MLRLVFLIALVGCAHDVSRPNPVGAPEARTEPLLGRIVLGVPAMHDDVSPYVDAWTRRLALLGLTGHITFDDERAVIDVYGGARVGLPQLAAILADHGGWVVNGAMSGGALDTWLAPNATCNCAGRVRVRYPRAWLCSARTGLHQLERGGQRFELFGRVIWRGLVGERVVELSRPPASYDCSAEHQVVWPDEIAFELPAGSTPEASAAIVLALAGGTLPAYDAIAIISPVGGAQ